MTSSLESLDEMKIFRGMGLEDRIAILERVAESNAFSAIQKTTLIDVARKMARYSENIVGSFALPMGIALLRVNGVKRMVPMVTEEKTVVAGLSKASKMAEPAGFAARASRELVQAHILFHLPTLAMSETVAESINKNASALAGALGVSFDCPSMRGRGGGLKMITAAAFAAKDRAYLEITLVVDTAEAMGAQYATELAERIGGFYGERFGRKPVTAIVANEASGRLVEVEAVWPFSSAPKTGGSSPAALAKGGGNLWEPGQAERFMMITEWAECRPSRAVTNNKGIMNGIVGAAIATGQDTRAIEAAAWTDAFVSGVCKPLARYRSTPEGIVGKMHLHLPIGTCGGATGIELVQSNQRLLCLTKHDPPRAASELAEVIVSVGLAQNFAALFQLSSSEGFSASRRRK
jgi:hydroxymethylglutaryl-CoA reductase